MSKPIKKAFQEPLKYLEQNKGKKVSDILTDFADRFCVGSTRGASVITDAKGLVVAILDSFDSRWKIVVGENAVGVSQRQDGKYNTISKANMPAYNARNTEINKAKEEREANFAFNCDLADQQASGKITGKQYTEMKKPLPDPEAIKLRPVESTEGYATEDECRAALAKDKSIEMPQ